MEIRLGRANDLAARALLLLVGGAVLAGCAGSAAASASGRITVAGAISGTYFPGPVSTCGGGPTTVAGVYGPNQYADQADLTVSDDGSVTLDALDHGLYSGQGVSFQPGRGWSIDADLSSTSSQRIHLSGFLSC